MSVNEIIEQLKAMADPGIAEHKKHFGIRIEDNLGIPVSALRRLAKQTGRDHRTALELWDSGIHEARILATMVEELQAFSEQQAEQWILEIRSWDLCDQFCSDLLRRMPFAHRKALEWNTRDEEYVKRAAFVLMATLAIHDKKVDDEVFENYLHIIKNAADDERNFVKKAINWALRQIGKRDLRMNKLAIACAEELSESQSRTARWVAADALRELKDEKTLARIEYKLNRKKNRR